MPVTTGSAAVRSPVEPTTRPRPARDDNRRGIVRISRHLIADIIDLPKDMRVVAIGTEQQMDTILLVVESDRLAPVSEGARLPDIGATAVIHTIRDGDEHYSRTVWNFGA